MQKREHTPSKGAAPKQYREIQDGDSPLLDRRYATRRTPVAAPIEAYHPVFAYFLAEYAREDLDPPSEIVSHTMKLMDSASQIATREAQRAESTRDALSDLLRHPVVQTVNPNLTSSDHMLLYMRQEDPRGSAAMIIIEEKYELGQSGEGCVQGSLSYHAHWIQDRGSLHKSCICPSFIISIAGPFIAVCGAIWTSDIIIQHLTGYMWMGRSGDIEEDRLLRVSRMFYALQRAVIRLKHYYEHLDPEIIDDKYRRFFPLATSYRDSNGTRVVFKYAAFLKEKDPSCVTFLATLEGSEQKVVVKFVERYGEEEHRLLAQHGYAPRLLYHGHIWDVEDNLEGETSVDVNAGCGTRRMVVMEYVEGKTLDNMDADVSREDVRKALHGIIDIMHQQKMVHGDIRTPNILLTGADQLDVKKRIRVLDFDWAGQEGIVRYPYGLSRDVKWAEGVEDHALIRKEHDVIMIGRV
ncbi:hypothetical protein K474DRAFT_1686212 [Panus rudis PR-1116 ss-1]|nr:hypothetical protein K474DRAFT_1686212 [Panus rudis PR-1116 ss-1]